MKFVNTVGLLLALLLPTAACADKAFTDLPAAGAMSGNEVVPMDQPNGGGGYDTVQTTLAVALKAIQAPGVSQKGGVYSQGASLHQFVTGVSTSGYVTIARPACADLSDAGAMCGSTDASGLTGTLAVGRLPAFASGDVTSSAGSSVLTIGAGRVTSAKMAAGAALGNIVDGSITAAKLDGGAAVASLGYTPLNPVSNLADIVDPATARGNLGVGSVAQLFDSQWTDYTPSISCTSGTITTLGTVYGRYKIIGHTAFFVQQITITTIGSCAGVLKSTAPVMSALQHGIPSAITGRISGGGSNQALSGHVAADSYDVVIVDYANNFFAASGVSFYISGTYEW